MPAPATASNMSISLPGNITSTDVVDFSISTSGGGTIDVTPITQASGTLRTYVEQPMGNTFEASVTYMGTARATVGAVGNVTIGGTTFYGVCTSSDGTAAVNDVARFSATFAQVTQE